MGYSEEWKSAIERSERYGLAVPKQTGMAHSGI